MKTIRTTDSIANDLIAKGDAEEVAGVPTGAGKAIPPAAPTVSVNDALASINNKPAKQLASGRVVPLPENPGDEVGTLNFANYVKSVAQYFDAPESAADSLFISGDSAFYFQAVGATFNLTGDHWPEAAEEFYKRKVHTTDPNADAWQHAGGSPVQHTRGGAVPQAPAAPAGETDQPLMPG